MALLLAVIASGLGATPAMADPSGDHLTGTEGMTIAGPNASTGIDVYNFNSGYAVVNWGDGTSDTCPHGENQTPSPTSGCFWNLNDNEFSGDVYGWHTYEHQGDYTITITDYDDENDAENTDTGSATVMDAPLTPQSTTVNTLVGASVSTAVGHFTDANPYGQAGEYTATIDWGDKTPIDSKTTITGTGGSSGFDVGGTHTYANPSPPGGYDVTVTVTDEPGAEPSSTTTIDSKVVATLTGSVSLSLQEGTPFSGTVAQFCGTPDPVTSATVDWGDGSGLDSGTTIAKTTLKGSTCYEVSGTHTYAEYASSPLTLTVTPNADSGAAAVTGSAAVADAPLTSTIDTSFLAENTVALPQSVIAHVTDGNPLAPSCAPGAACDLTAQIDWGDSSAAQDGTVAPDPSGGFEIIGGPHEFPAPGSYTVSVTVNDAGGATTQAQATYVVTPPPKPLLGCESPVPDVGAQTGLYGAPVPAGSQTNWGISSDDRVLRFGNLVLCAADAAWVYDGASTSSQVGGLGLSSGGGAFHVEGRVIVNGLELEGNGLSVDTATGQISGGGQQVKLSNETFSPYPSDAGELGYVDLTANPWVLQGQTLAYIQPNSSYDTVGSLALSGPLQVIVDGLGTVSVTGNAQMPSAFSLQSYSGGAATGPVSFPDEYPGLLGGGAAPHQRGAERAHRVSAPIAHAADDGCTYPPAPANAPIAVHSDDLYLGGIDMHCAYLYVDPSTGTEEGGGGFGIGPVYVNGYFGFKGGAFDHAGGGVDGLNLEVFPGLALNSIHFGVFLNPTRFHADATFEVGEGLLDITGSNLTVFATPSHTYAYDQDKPITGNDDLIGTTGVLSSPFSTTTVGIGGDFKPLGLFDVHGYVLYEYPAYIEIGGHFDYDTGIVSADGNIQGQFWLPRAFDIEGNLDECFVGLCSNARGLVSSRGVTGCWDVTINYLIGSTTWSVGGAYRWGASGPSVYIPPFSDSCDDHFGDYRVTGAASAVTPSGARTFHLGPGLHSVMVKVTGSGDAPAFTLSGPHGVSSVTGAENQLTGGGTVGTFRSQSVSTTWVAILHPGAGTWTITPQAGSAAITSLALANYIPGASVHTHVSGRGYHRILHYTLRPRPGQSVRLIESAKGVTRSIATVTAPHGAIPFTPAIGRAGRRQILAQVSREGLLQAEYAVGSYHAPGPPRAARPPHLTLSRHASQLFVSWGAAANATGGYQIVVITSDGRRLLFQRPSKQRSVTVPAFSSSGATVMVEGVGPDGNTGATATARLKPLGAPARVTALRVLRTGANGIRVSWKPAARAQAYRVAVTVTGAPRPLLIVTTKRSLTFTVASASVGVTASVQGQGALNVLGPAVSARLGAAAPKRHHRRHKKHRHHGKTKPRHG